MKKRAVILLLFSCVYSFAASTYADAVPLRVGPVSYYGALGTDGNKIIGQSNNKQAMLRGMSLFWSDAIGSSYYNADVISWAVQNLGINVFRFAMGIQYYDSDGGTSNAIDGLRSYLGNPSGKISSLDAMVKTAIENDVYIIIDWHSHRAQYEQSAALDFFTSMAERYKGIPNIIWEVYNEPINTDWGTIKNYATTVISGIRQNSSNLALVGTSNWSQHPEEANTSAISATNVAYVFHFYAGSHSVGDFGGNITSALNAGHAVFISEWGTTDANGNGSVNSSETANWITFMENNKISNCNWSLRHATADSKTEASAMFDGSTVLTTQSALSAASYTSSGTLAKNYLTQHISNWSDSLTAGYRSGSCAFAHQTVPGSEGTVSGVANAGCTYTSSKEAVATIAGGVITVKSAGYTVMTGNDGTKSIVTVTLMPGQTFSFPAYTCRLNMTCTGEAMGNFSGSNDHEKKLNRELTEQGGTITYSSDNPTVISVQKVTCNGTSCVTSLKGTPVWVARFNALGTAVIHATAPAVTGYRAMDTTVIFSYLKNQQKINTGIFKNQSVALNSTTQMFSLTAAFESVPVTYTFDTNYGTQDGANFVAGNLDATLAIVATVPETDNYEGLSLSIQVIIGTGVMGIDKVVADVPFKARVVADGISFDLQNSGWVQMQILDVSGRQVGKSIQQYFVAGSHRIDIGDLSAGRYFVKIQQASFSKTFAWSKK